MTPFDDFDPALFGLWQARARYDPETDAGDDRPGGPGPGVSQDDLVREVRALLLEIKSVALSPATIEAATATALGPTMARPADAGEDLRRLLNEMTAEMRDQFATFRALRRSADGVLSGGDEAEQKLARADVKAATDAMSLIVRTLEKVDALQRQLARDRDLAAEQAAETGGYEDAKARFVAMIEDRAREIALDLFAAWQRDGPAAADRRPQEQGPWERGPGASGPSEPGPSAPSPSKPGLREPDLEEPDPSKPVQRGQGQSGQEQIRQDQTRR